MQQVYQVLLCLILQVMLLILNIMKVVEVWICVKMSLHVILDQRVIVNTLKKTLIVMVTV